MVVEAHFFVIFWVCLPNNNLRSRSTIIWTLLGALLTARLIFSNANTNALQTITSVTTQDITTTAHFSSFSELANRIKLTASVTTRNRNLHSQTNERTTVPKPHATRLTSSKIKTPFRICSRRLDLTCRAEMKEIDWCVPSRFSDPRKSGRADRNCLRV